VLPLVSKRWASIMKRSAIVWREACLDTKEFLVQRRNGRDVGVYSADLAVMAAWFQKRRDRFMKMGIKAAYSFLQLPPVLAPLLLSTQAGSLTHLSIGLPACGLRGHELEVLAALHGLMALDVHLLGCGLDDRGAAICRAASAMTALRQLDVRFTVDPHADEPRQQQRKISLPRCCELSKLRSQSIEHLSVATSCGSTADVLRLAGMPNLITCHLLGDSCSGAELRIDSLSFAGCESLGELTLHHQRGLDLHPGCFDACSALISLTLTHCSLRCIPSACAALTALKVLNLSQNKNLDVDAAGTKLLRAMSELGILDVAKPDTAVHAAGSTQALFDLVKAFADDQLLLRVNVDPTLSETYEADSVYWGEEFD